MCGSVDDDTLLPLMYVSSSYIITFTLLNQHMNRDAQKAGHSSEIRQYGITLGSGYIGFGYISFSAITSIFASYFWSQKEVYIIDYFGNIVISDLSSIFAWSQRGRYIRNPVYIIGLLYDVGAEVTE